MAQVLAIAFVLVLALAPATALGADSPTAPPQPNRSEFVPAPVIGGNSDTGVQLGVMGSYARFREGYYPYRLRLDAILSASFKIDSGIRAVQHYDALRVDAPQLFARRVRLEVRADFLRRVDAAWIGVGNDPPSASAPPPSDEARTQEFLNLHTRLRALARIRIEAPFELALFANTRYERPEAYAVSKLAEDLAAGVVVGREPSLLQTLAAGLMVDTRDNEFMPRRGIFYQLGVGGTLGAAESVRFGEASAALMHFAPLGAWVVFASRMLGSFKWGTVPYYELQLGDVFEPRELIGGARGLRGVLLGRYSGLVKVLSNTELRFSPIPRFRILHWSVLAGAIAFFDAGRVWASYELDPTADGRKLGLKYGTGGGAFFQWDEASVFRIEAAYSPDQGAGAFPVSFYFESGFIF